MATFTPQVFWFAMILAPRNPVVKTVMGSWLPVLIASGIHFYVDYVGFNQPGALEEAAKFGAVFDPTIAPWDWANGAVTGPLLGFQSMLENQTLSPRSGRTCWRGTSSSVGGCGSTRSNATCRSCGPAS